MSVVKVFKTGGSQAIRIPKKYQFNVDEVFINPLGDKLVLTPKRSNKWMDIYYRMKKMPDSKIQKNIEELPYENRDWSAFK